MSRQTLPDQIRFKLIDSFVSYKPFQLHGCENLSQRIASLGYLTADIIVNVKNFKQSKKHKRTGLSDDKINLPIDNLSGKEDYRLRAILALLTLQGLR